MSTEVKAAKAAELEEVKLAGPHTHNGVDYKAGDKIKVSAKQKAFLVAFKKVDAPANQEAK